VHVGIVPMRNGGDDEKKEEKRVWNHILELETDNRRGISPSILGFFQLTDPPSVLQP
jgi:hypothetical protein